uniref:Uncharacterized protein n=1 Tax=Quercus lobata TaxID=97700 RepID=A0A7N2L5W7_QUELO
MQCKEPGYPIAHATTLSILNNLLSRYSWDAKAVLTLAAFALDYGEFCLLVKIQSSKELAKSVGTLKRVPVLLKGVTMQKNQQAFIDLNKVVKTTMKVIKCIFELEKLSNFDFDTKDGSELATVLGRIKLDVYWAITTIVASTTQLSSCLIFDEDKKQELNPFADKLNVILTELEKQIVFCKEQIAETQDYGKLVKLFQTSMEITEVLHELIDPTNRMQPLIDGSTKTQVEIDVLKGKSVFLFISYLEISNDDISMLQKFFDKAGKEEEEQNKIVWIPFVEFIKKQWNFKVKPLLVVLNPQGKMECENAILIFSIYGVEAFPFTSAKVKTMETDFSWLWSPIINANSEIENWIKEKKYIFLYGGQDKEWIQKFPERVKVLAEQDLIKQKGISIQWVSVSESEGKVDLVRFWTNIESLFISKAQGKTQIDEVAQEIQKLLSYENEKEWVVLTKGSSVVLVSSGEVILKVVEEFEKWKIKLNEKDFALAFKDYHDEVFKDEKHICHHIKIPYNTGKIPETLECSHCQRIMDTHISYKCCHNDGAT